MLKGSKRIQELYEDDEFQPIIVNGGHGYGKTSYANILISEVYSFKNNPMKPYWNWEHFQRHLGFAPEEVLREWIHKKKRDYCYHWDDSGLWLNSLDFQDPFVKDVGKYMQVVRTDWACVMFSAINAEDISSKIRGLRNAIIIDITKEGKDYYHPYRRTAVAYIIQKSMKGKPWRDVQWEDPFDCHVPDEFYRKYKPLRDAYASMAKEAASKRWEEKKLMEIELRIRKLALREKVKQYMQKEKEAKVA